MVVTITIGVLALQGAFSEHLQLLRKAFAILEAGEESTRVNWKDIEVRTEEQLFSCDALIVPGGESTAISLVAERSGLLEPLRNFVKCVDLKLTSNHPKLILRQDREKTDLGNMCRLDFAG